MKKIILLSAGLLAFVACDNQKKDSTEKLDTPIEKPIGVNKDEHGCNSAAGQTWSELKSSCIQVFNVGERLNPIDTKQDEAVISAFVVYNDDKSKLELFLADKPNVILEKSEGSFYQNDTYKFDTKESALYINGEKKYIAEK
ncbi:hypothetical protein SAMN05443634_104155 [Chishuiella changwenlii]|uniref:Uncharacterized protein n=1 Tax=Chishuiella changwenlii TaxID=1434701 RepID=A0A1M6W3X2_9FLAO|nr:hypothetical protein [Chishuiella changwenlii]GGE89054.1 hypothetical protein GCM10010984_03380 [Chishuiella changwenlii]SHK88474.1 hypothetical protein SAMN05443634_104155 [Chishuiella changwenlii]